MSFCQGWRQIQLSLSPYITDNFLIPFLSDSLHIPVSLFLIRRVTDGLQIVREFLPVFVSHVFQRVSHHMYNASLVFSHREGCRYSVSYSGKSIRAEHEYVLHTAVFEFVQYAEPELRAFALTDCYGQHFLVSFLADTEDNVCRLFAYDAVVTDVEYYSVDRPVRLPDLSVSN